MAQNLLAIQSLAERIRKLLELGEIKNAIQLIQNEHPADIADLLEQLDEPQRTLLFQELNLVEAGEVLDEISTEATIELVDAVPDESIADILETLPVNDAAEVLTEIETKRAEQILNLIEPEDAQEIGKLLAYPDQSAGRLMTTEVVRIQEDWTVQGTLDYLRKQAEKSDTLAYLYVVDRSEHLVGVLSLRVLVTENPEVIVRDVMDKDVITVDVMADQEDAARLVEHYDFYAIPVVDSEYRFVGILTHDDVVDILQEEFTEDIQRMGGSQPLESEYLASSVLTVFQKRITWLLVLFLTSMLTGSVMRYYEHDLQVVVALSFFIPLLIGTGGNSGSQATSTIVRALAMREVLVKDVWRLLWHEMRAGFLLGLAMGVIGFGRALLWHSGIPLALTVAAALFAIVLWANAIGAILPPLASKLKVDPAVISGPVMSTLVDATGLIIYFTLARWIIGL
ncbi:MAG: magnesium transporter [Anaerolineales bacterium]|jgi:magnesium transporter